MKSNKQLLVQYAGFAFQLLVSLAIAVVLGLWVDDKWLGFPLLVWLFPLLIIILTIVKAIKDTKKQ